MFLFTINYVCFCQSTNRQRANHTVSEERGWGLSRYGLKPGHVEWGWKERWPVVVRRCSCFLSFWGMASSGYPLLRARHSQWAQSLCAQWVCGCGWTNLSILYYHDITISYHFAYFHCFMAIVKYAMYTYALKNMFKCFGACACYLLFVKYGFNDVKTEICVNIKKWTWEIIDIFASSSRFCFLICIGCQG